MQVAEVFDHEWIATAPSSTSSASRRNFRFVECRGTVEL
jgi:hypothetical protein